MNRTAFSGYVLAGGKSLRMKTDKAFLQIGGKTFLQNASETLETVLGKQVKIILNRSQMNFIERLPKNMPVIFDRFENRGALGGIHAALFDCETKYAVILAVDLPLVNAEAIENLIKIAKISDEFDAVVPRQIDGRFQPLCAIYQTHTCLPPLEKLLNQTDKASAQMFLDLINPHFTNQRQLTDQDNDIFYNVNYPADFESI